MGPLVALWLLFASAVSGLPIPPGPPPLVTLDEPAEPDHPTLGSTDLADGHIRLRPGWHGRSAADRCVLAHELTHWLQVRNGQDFPCSAGVEPPAYRVEALCFHILGQPQEETQMLNRAEMFQCR